MNDFGKPISPEVLKKMEKQVKRINDFRGETAAGHTEVEALLDEILIKYFIRPERQEKFYDVLWWPSFSFPTKIRLLELIDPKYIGGKKNATKLVENIKQINTIRNQAVHGLTVIGDPSKYF